MPIYVLAETAAGYGIFQSNDKKLLKRDDLSERLKDSEKIRDMLTLKKFAKYESATVALEEMVALTKGQIPPMLAEILADMNKEAKATVAVADLKLAQAITQLPQFDVKAVAGSNLGSLYRSIREHMTSLVQGLTQQDLEKTSLGLAHSFSRNKLKFSADKVDAMVCHAVKTLDDLDKEGNVYAMRTKEWYNWHFPELAKILNDNVTYARVIIAAGTRPNYANTDLSDILTEELETQVKTVAERSMGTDITDEDIANCKLLARQVIDYASIRKELSSYLQSRMQAIAPNLTALVGYLVGARLIAHVGSVMSLAKNPSSTIQILGAEKALFRALKTKHDTPKYGLIYHSSLVGQATGKNKGKVARMLAAKAALGIRVDALDSSKGGSEEYEDRSSLGQSLRLKLENRLRYLEGKPRLPEGAGIGPDGQVLGPGQLTLRETRRYNADADGISNGAANGVVKSHTTTKKLGKMIEVVESKDVEMQDTGDEDEENKPRAESETQKDKRSEREGQRQQKKGHQKKSTDMEAGKAPNEAPKSTAQSSKLSDDDYVRLAELAGIPVKKFRRKFERGDVELTANGTPRVHSKKELKKMRKAGEAGEAGEAGGANKDDAAPAKPSKTEAGAQAVSKKRKHDDSEDDAAEGSKSGKKRKHEADDEDQPREKKSKKEKRDKKDKQDKQEKKEKKEKEKKEKKEKKKMTTV